MYVSDMDIAMITQDVWRAFIGLEVDGPVPTAEFGRDDHPSCGASIEIMGAWRGRVVLDCSPVLAGVAVDNVDDGAPEAQLGLQTLRVQRIKENEPGLQAADELLADHEQRRVGLHLAHADRRVAAVVRQGETRAERDGRGHRLGGRAQGAQRGQGNGEQQGLELHRGAPAAGGVAGKRWAGS